LKGIYALIIQVNKNVDVPIGKLGTLNFPSGHYAYVGSAQKGIEKRVERHLRREKRVFWHVDYLLQNPHSAILKVFWREGDRHSECELASKIAAEGEAVTGFGSSDCHCKSHLFRIKQFDFFSRSMETLM